MAADFHAASPFHHLTCLTYIAACKVELGEYHSVFVCQILGECHSVL
ncbi:hypothetical protein E2C01_100749 [Portunus trituberculatus]|uniref:Uncharacterized protein n=1 Tax=Portunus trituberculatus TaxID=210409 RepID=A0A5B7KIP7_PORTR|nr:hypothetical protein [Portunus trituberculatus]